MRPPRVLVDTNIWIDHFNRSDSGLVFLLQEGEVLVHPFVVGELALGNLKHRAMLLEFMEDMPNSREVSIDEAITLVHRRKLFSRGIGIVDAVLLASALVTPDTKLWTRDKRLANIAGELGAAYSPT